MTLRFPAALLTALLAGGAVADPTEFCIDGYFDLGTRLQGMHPGPGEVSPATWCVVTEPSSSRAVFSATGRSNPDMAGDWTVAFLPPDVVRIVQRDAPPDIEFHGAAVGVEALRHRRLDPRRLVAELEAHPAWQTVDDDGWRIVRYPGAADPVWAHVFGGVLHTLKTSAALPLSGRVPVVWSWGWDDPDRPTVLLTVDGEPLFSGRGRWRVLDETAADAIWQATPGVEPVTVPGENWPSRVEMQALELADGVFIVRGVRTGFQHLVVVTGAGLVVADAPAGWVEIHQVPPADLVPGKGVSGLSEDFVDFLARSFPEQAIRAVAITHFHDDHAGGARAFAAAGAEIFAPAPTAGFLATALNRAAMPDDRLARAGGEFTVRGVARPLTIDGQENRVRLMPMGAGPHVSASLGVWAVDRGFFFVSDVHVPNSDDDEPRADRAVTECWFAGWAVANLPPEVVVLNSHSSPRTPVSRLARYLESDLCGDR